MNNLSISFQSSLIAIYVIIGLVALAVSWWSYRNLVPHISQFKRIFLITLRSLGIFFLALLLVEPLLTRYSEKTIGNRLGVVFDLSTSMCIEDDNSSRVNMARNAFIQHADIDYGANYYGFSDSLIDINHIPDSADCSGRATDLALAISEPLARDGDELGALLVISDGAGNIGADPLPSAMEASVPIYSLVVGKRISFNDIAITTVDYPPVSYINTEISLTAEVKSSGYAGKVVLLEIKDGGKIIGSKRITLPGDGAHTTIDLPVTFTEEGVHSLEASIGVLEDEVYADNNVRNFTIKLLKDKTSILLLSSSLNWEYTFIQRALSSDEHFEVQSAIAGGNNTIPGRELPTGLESWKNIDLIVAIDIPSRSVGSQINVLKQAVESGTGFLFIAGDKTRLMPLAGWDDILPLESSPRISLETGEFFPVPGEQAIVKTITDIEDLRWSDLSPLEFVFKGFNIKQNAVIFLDAVDITDSHYPVLVGGAYKTGKTAAMVGYPWWKRSFRPATSEQASQGMIKFWGNLVRWLVAREDLDKFNLVSDKSVYRLGEPVKFNAILFDDSYNLLSGSQINVDIADSNGSKREFRLTSTEAGKYTGVYGSPAAGKYDFRGYAISEGDTLGVTDGSFIVESFSLEMENPSANFAVMSQIASVTGGVSYTVDNFDEFKNDLKLNTKTANIFREYSPTGNLYILILVILLFTLEWGIRKFSQLA